MSDRYSDEEIAEAQRLYAERHGRPMSEEEQRHSFGRVVKPDNPSSRTIRSYELPPRDTTQSGAHAKPSFAARAARALGFGKDKKD